ncbi:type II secretion system F family protein [Frankia tisae]|uniref:type II secretion system F family protein n=1 Tax=Frankia tisae TaxID=2950104 RepID=UPI0021BFE16F|nr:type II secretion system F family protein [Frankia tisae]
MITSMGATGSATRVRRRGPDGTARTNRAAAVAVAPTAMLGIAVLGTAAVLAVSAGPVAAVTVSVSLGCLARAVRRERARRRQAMVRACAEDFLAAFAAELDAGGPHGPALRAAAGGIDALGTAPGRGPGWIPLDQLAATLAGADDPGVVLCRNEANAVRQLGIAYQVCTMVGARLAPVATMLASLARADAVRAGELAAALAGPRSSGRLVAALPLAGIALGSLAGGHPLHTLLATPAGNACLVAGSVADLVGLRWLRSFADRVERRAGPVAMDAARTGGPAGTGTGRERLLADLPLALDLIAACLRGGGTVVAALVSVGAANGGVLGRELHRAADAMAAGVDAHTACHRLVAVTVTRGRAAWLARLLRGNPRASPGSRWTAMMRAAVSAFDRAQTSGAKPAAALVRLAQRARDEAHAESIAAARRAGVLAVAPLGLCFLPAFLLIGVVPVVLGSLPNLLPA